MTNAQKRGIATALGTTLGGTFLIWLASAAWHAVTPRAEFEDHVKAERGEFQLHLEQELKHRALDSARARAQSELLLDVLCAVKDQRDRRCK